MPRPGSLLSRAFPCERRAYNSGLSESVRERDVVGAQICRRYLPLSFAGDAGSLSYSAGIEGLQSWSVDRRVRVVAGRSTKWSIIFYLLIGWEGDRQREDRVSARRIRDNREIFRERATTTSDVPREHSSGKQLINFTIARNIDCVICDARGESIYWHLTSAPGIYSRDKRVSSGW